MPETDGSVEVSDPAATPTPEQLTRVVALDGPAGSGKTTVARRVAAQLGWRFVDTGATYRAVTLAALRAGAALDAADALGATARAARVTLSTDPAEAWVRLDDEDVTSEIRGEPVTSAVSAVSAVPGVRAELIALQRRLMGTTGAVVEGRDIATVVAPRAAVKVYLDADPAERARRRAGEQARDADRPADARRTTEAVQAALQARDALDNKTNALQASDGALHLDTTELSLPEVVNAVVALVVRAGLVTPQDADSVEARP